MEVQDGRADLIDAQSTGRIPPTTTTTTSGHNLAYH